MYGIILICLIIFISARTDRRHRREEIETVRSNYENLRSDYEALKEENETLKSQLSDYNIIAEKDVKIAEQKDTITKIENGRQIFSYFNDGGENILTNGNDNNQDHQHQQ
ncbi:1670_t:CDS:2 [Ambispora leptoticha]|uniref:1670_t:CDS:1 n=1 Tax=Ambispora leptoticha TaxID=144679 RepID=A0A9N8YM17_9GLOM|nr:1670_t:CDS:2 [Ambispora leptoticha]